MPFAGRMKLSTFVVAIVSAGVLAGVALSFLPDPPPEPEPVPIPEFVPQVEAYDPPQEATSEEAPATEATEASAPAGPTLDPVDEALFKWQGKELGAEKKKDVTQGRPFKINVYQDAGEATANRAKVDLDRDDKWDIKVTFGDPTTRKVASADDENYDIEQTWDGATWLPPL